MEIRKSDIYKIYILDSQGSVKKILLFSGGLKDQTHMSELFSDIENSEIVANQIQVSFSQFQLHLDDSIRIIKNKILQELGSNKVSYEEIYLFAKIEENFDMEKIYKNIVKKSKKDTSNIPKEFRKEQFGQFISNLELDDETIETVMSDGPKEVYTYDDLQLVNRKKRPIQTAIGQRFLEYRDYLFSANPFDIRNISTSRFEISQENPLLAFENELLLNSGDVIDNIIYVCLAENAFELAFNTKIDEEYVAMLYYPLLFSKGIKTNSQLVASRAELLRETQRMLTPISMQIYKTVDMFYNIYNNKRIDLPYADQGVQSIFLVIKSGFSAHIPLESIFKNIHATKQCPFIKFNPGNRRENMYRLYTERVSKNGKKIPQLAESAIMKLSRETGKGKQISMYLAEQELYIDFENTGNMYVRSNFKKPVSYESLNEMMTAHVQPIIDIFNGILQQTGLSLLPLGNLRDSHIEILNIKYIWALTSEKVFSLNKYTSCIASVFNIVTDDLTKAVNMQFKRVENFKEMDAQAELITNVLKNSNDYEEVVRVLMMNYSMTHEEAIIRVAEYTSENRELGGRILENPGFPVKMYYPVNQKKLVVEIDNISAIQYLDVLAVYVDSILRILSGSNDIPKAAGVQTNCTKSVKITKDSDKSQFDNVTAVTGLSLIRPIKKIQPLTFDFGDDEEEDDDKDEKLDQDKEIEEDELEFEMEEAELNENVLKEVDLSQKDDDDSGFYLSQESETDLSLIPQVDTLPKGEVLQQRAETNSIFTPLNTKSTITIPLTNLDQESPKSIEEVQEQEQEEESPKSIEESPKSIEESPKSIESDEGFALEEYEEETSPNSIESANVSNTKQKKGGEDTPSTDSSSPSSSATSSTPSLAEQTVNIDGMSLHNFFLNRLKGRDEKLFLTKKEGQYSSYAKSCAANIQRQPVILTDKEKDEIDKHNPGSYSNAVKYGSDAENQFWYVCPRYWCLKTNSAISEADVKAGKCGTIIPQGAKTVPKGAYVYEFNSHTKEHINTKGEYIEHYPGFIEDAHPSGSCLPCCFKLQQNESTKSWEMSKEQIKRRERCAKDIKVDKINPENKFISYIKSSAIIPIEPKRWGFLPISAQLFLKTNNSATTVKTNPAQIRPNTPCLLRYGVEQHPNQSFLGCIAEMYGYKQGMEVPRVNAMKQLLVEAMTIDLFIKYHNGSLISVFKPTMIEIEKIDVESQEYQNSAFVKSIKIADETQYDFLVDTIAAFENFKKYLLDETAPIDHTYLWDMITGNNPKLMKDGVNLVIMEIANNDITDKIELVCPTNSYAQTLYDPRKETVLVLKQGEFYEMVYLYEERSGQIHELKTFINKPTTLKNIVEILELVQNSAKNYCTPQASRPRVYNFAKNILANELYRLLKTYQYDATAQIMNYQGKIIGLLSKHDESDITIFVPCLPSAQLMEIPIQYMDEDIWTDYTTTVRTLRKIKMDSRNKILCEPKFKVLEDGLIVGIIVETNQFVQVSPPSENIEMEDGLETVNEANDLVEIIGSNDLAADAVIETSKTPDLKRSEAIKKIALESNFFSVFRTTIRNLLNNYENRELRQSILTILETSSKMYKQKLTIIIEKLHELVAETIRFDQFNMKDLLEMDDIVGCSKNCASDTNIKKYCLKEGDKCTLLIPDKHLISELDNEEIYYSRIADELIRYKRIRLFMFQTNFYLNITDNQYKILDNEFMILQSTIGSDYFKDLKSFNSTPYIKNITYDVAEPSVTQTYVNEVTLEDQQEMVQNLQDQDAPGKLDEFTIECIKKREKVIGNIQNSMWKRSFPKQTDEIVFKNTVACSYYAIISIMQERFKSAISIQQVKEFLWKGYSELMAANSGKITSILKLQGKRDMVERIVAKKLDLETAIFSEEYYITDLDLWILAKGASLPVILFSALQLKQLSPSINWLLLGGNVYEKLYFIRTPGGEITPNVPPEYHLIAQPFPFSELKEFRQIMEKAVASDPEYRQNMQSLDNYLQAFTLIVKKRGPIKPLKI